MGLAVDASTPKDKLLEEYRRLSREALSDPQFRQKFFEQAKKAGLIQ